LNGVHPDIRHVLDSEITKCGTLTPVQMHQAVKKHEAYVARNQCLDGRGPYHGQQRATASTSGYKPCYQKTTAFVTSASNASSALEPVPEPEAEAEEIITEPESTDSDGLYIPGFLAGNGNLELAVKMAHTIQAEEQRDRRCYPSLSCCIQIGCREGIC